MEAAGGELVSIRLPDGFRVYRWLIPGEIVDIPWSLPDPEVQTERAFPVIYQRETDLELAGLGPIVVVADRPRVADLRGASAEESARLLERNAASLSTVILPGERLGDERLRAALGRLSANDLFLSIAGGAWMPPS